MVELERRTKTPITIRATYGIRDYLLGQGERLEVTVNGEPPCTVVVRKPEPTDVLADQIAVALVAEVTKKVSEAVLEGLRALAKGKWPSGSTPFSHSSVFYEPVEGRAPYFDELPENLRQLSSEQKKRLHEAAAQVMQTLRWRCAADGPPLPFSSRPCFWSEDNKTWHFLPEALRARVSIRRGLVLTTENQAEIGRLLHEAKTEPVAHSLMREAMHLLPEHPRAALAIAMTALEVGVKDLIATLVPDAGWLLETGPTPPVESMLRDYLKRLPLRNDFGGQALTLGEKTIKTVKTAVHSRNTLVHRGASVDDEFARDVVKAVGNLLWLLDYYAGNSWALEYLDRQQLES